MRTYATRNKQKARNIAERSATEQQVAMHVVKYPSGEFAAVRANYRMCSYSIMRCIVDTVTPNS